MLPTKCMRGEKIIEVSTLALKGLSRCRHEFIDQACRIGGDMEEQ